MKTMTIERSDVPTLLSLIPRSQFFTVTFFKKDGTKRTMNCRRGVKAYLNPNPSRPRPTMPANEITVYEPKAGGYRMFNIDTLVSIKALGTEIIITDEAA